MESENERENIPLLKEQGSCFGVRHIMSFLLFLAMGINYSMRTNLSIAIVQMMDNTNNPDFEEFDWSSSTKNTILSSFFWGYIVTQVPSGLIAQRFGAKWPLLVGTTMCSLLTVLTPVVTSAGGWGAICALRVLEGLSQGTLFPSIHALLANWVPANERGRIGAFVMSGMQIGTVFTFPVSGVLASSAGGWPSIFYLFGGLGFGWCILWFFVGASKPDDHFLISPEEKEYIQAELGNKSTVASLRVPWFSLATSLPMWALTLAHCAQSWGFWTLMTEIPTYMSKVLDFDIKANGLLSALPYLVQGILTFILGFVADKLLNKGIITTTTSRKIFNTFGFWLPAATLCGLGYVNRDQVTLGVVLLVVSVGLNAGAYCGFQINHIDLSPNFAPTMMGITNGLSNIMSILGPLLVGIVVTKETSTEQWRIIFFVAAAFYFIGNVIFVVFGSAEKQPWNDPELHNRTRSKSLDQSEKNGRSFLGVRHLMSFLLFLAMSVCFAMRTNLSIAIVQMMDNKENPDFDEFDWSTSTKNTVLSSFFWGYIVTQVPSGMVAQRFGAKWPVLVGTAICSLMTILTPVVTSAGGWGGLCAVRVIEGLAQGTLFPSIHAILASWAPANERARMGAFIFAGMQMGTIVCFPVSGVLASSAGGWPSIFYLFGGLGLVWCVLWFFFAASKPDDHFLISTAEKEYIQAGLGNKSSVGSLRVPWLSLATSPPMWAVTLAHCAQSWGFWTLMTQIPTYMSKVLDFDIKDNGLLSALPYLVQGILTFVIGFTADQLLNRGIITTTTSRKIFNTIGFWLPAATLCGLGYVTRDEITLCLVLLVVSVGLNAGVTCGFQINHLDLSPNFAPTMMGISNGMSNIMSILGPLLVGVVVTTETSTEQWRIIFFVSAAIYFTGNLAFLVFGSAEKQAWNDPEHHDRSRSGTGSVTQSEKTNGPPSDNL